MKQIRRVVILNELGMISSPGYAEVDQAIQAGLQRSPYQIELYVESLEVTLFPDEVSQRRFREQFILKYSDRKPDVIIAVGSESLKFVAQSQEKFLRNTPIVFCTILDKIPDELRRDMHFTGVLGRLRPEETLTAALHMLPDTKRVVVVGGTGTFDRVWENTAKQAFQSYEPKLEFTYLTNMTMPALLERLKRLPNNTIIYHTALTQDAAGQRFIDSAQSVPLLAGAANAPIFVMDDVDLRGGTVGGDLVNWSDDARVAAEMAVRVLNGEKTEDIPIVTSTDAYLFDWNALHRWGIKETTLPPGSVVLNRPPDFWLFYKRYIWAGAFAFSIQTLVIFALLWQRRERRRSESKLRESEERFRLVANTAPVMIWMSGPDTLYTYFNNPWLAFTGRSIQQELGNGWLEGVHQDDMQRCLETYSKAFHKRESFEMAYRLRRHDGVYRWVLDLGVPRFNPEGSFAGYIGSCLDVTERKEAEEVLSTVSRRLIEAHEEERSWVARELHDDVNQRLALIAVNLDIFRNDLPSAQKKNAKEIKEQIQGLSYDVQALSHRLHSSKLEYLGLSAAAASYCRELSERKDVHIDFQCGKLPETLSKEVSLCLFRVLQEAVQNAVKHSGVREFQVLLESTRNEVELTVRDSGTGFDIDAAINGHGLGLISMKERLKLVDGELFVESERQHGTTVQARVPLKPNAAAAHQ